MSVTIKLSKRAARGRWGNRARAAAAVLASAVAVGGVGTAQAAAATPTLLSYTSPTRLVQSTGNLYWTTNSYNRSSATYTSTVYRASKTNTPGDEITLFSKSSATPFSFGDLTYAQVGGTWYGYFVVNYPDAGYSQIARIGLTPTASATILQSDVPMIGDDDLVTDGSYLYWADAKGLHKTAIGGGGGTAVLASGTNFSRVGLNGSNVVYSAGDDILSVPKAGGTPTTLVAAASPISAMAVSEPGDYEVLVYGESNGAVIENGYIEPGDTTVETLEPARVGYTITTVGMNGPEAVFGECDGVTNCDINGTTSTPGTPVDVQGDGQSIYWGSNALYSMQDTVIE